MAAAFVCAWILAAKPDRSPPESSDPRSIQASARVQRSVSERIAFGIDRLIYQQLPPADQEIVARLAAEIGRSPPRFAVCFAPGTPDAVVAAYQTILDQIWSTGTRFQQTDRWSSTATNGGPLFQGDPTTLTYSFVPDGTTIPDIGIGGGPSELEAFLNGIYGDTATWKAIYAQMFARWSQLSGITFVLESNDDGVELHNNPGVLGVRGDLRMAGRPINGPGGVLAYNAFPDDGDMVIDTSDTFYNDTSDDSLRLRNVLAHEHGHGMGQLHVCPANQTKLMEPFATTAFDGPQHDDIQNAQRHYGDNREDNDSIGTATSLGILPDAVTTVADVGADDAADVDFYAFTLSQDTTDLIITLRPIGLTYVQGPQNEGGSCSAGSSYNSIAVNDLGIEVIGTDGSTVIATVNAQPAGNDESIQLILEGAGTYYVRVFAGPVAQVQLYELDLDALGLMHIPMQIVLPNGPPTLMPPGVPTSFDVEIIPNDEELQPGTALLWYRYDAGVFQSTALTPVAGNLYTATLPPPDCGDTPQFYISATGNLSGVITKPAGGAASPYVAGVGSTSVLLSDDFETDQGWVIGAADDDATTGIWERVDPVGTIAQPEDDHSPDPGTFCFVTGQGSPGGDPGVNDVDDGKTTLISPLIDLNIGTATISYWRWYSNVEGAAPNEDVMTVDVSNQNGLDGTWVNVETVGPFGPETEGGWYYHEFNVSDYVLPSGSVRVRFVVRDADAGSLVEAAIDDFHVQRFTCGNQPPNCAMPGDLNFDTAINGLDLPEFLKARITGPYNGCADLAVPYGDPIDDADTTAFVDLLLTHP